MDSPRYPTCGDGRERQAEVVRRTVQTKSAAARQLQPTRCRGGRTAAAAADIARRPGNLARHSRAQQGPEPIPCKPGAGQ